MVPPKNAGPLQDALPEKQVVTIPECGHSMMAEAPDVVLDALRQFIAGLS
jgi:pimeloyl-ACP methyl ester carboxylesterase